MWFIFLLHGQHLAANITSQAVAKHQGKEGLVVVSVFQLRSIMDGEPLPAAIGRGLMPAGPQESLGRGEFYLLASSLPRMALDSMLFPEHCPV